MTTLIDNDLEDPRNDYTLEACILALYVHSEDNIVVDRPELDAQKMFSSASNLAMTCETEVLDNNEDDTGSYEFLDAIDSLSIFMDDDYDIITNDENNKNLCNIDVCNDT